MTISVTEHHKMARHPYYLYAPGFSERSSGIRVLHYLCHILNLNGYEAYIKSESTADELWSPLLTDDIMARHYRAGRKPIVVYPEVIRGTPLGLGTKVRWLLNRPGKIAGHTEFDPDEIMVAYRDAFTDDPTAPLLTVPTSDPSLFNPGLPTEERQGRYVYHNRLLPRGGHLQALTENAIEISPRHPKPHHELAEIFKRAELLYCYEDGTITLEARMCGCPVVYVPNPTMLTDFPKEDWGCTGAAWGDSPEQIQHAKKTVGEIYPAAIELYERFDIQLEHFIELTQAAAEAQPLEQCFPEATTQRYGWPPLNNFKLRTAVSLNRDPNYDAWLKRTSLQEIDGQLLAERIQTKWKFRPHFNVIIEVRDDEQVLLADTLDSIAMQWYKDWHLTIIAPFPPSDPEITQHPQLTWVVRSDEESIKESVDWAIANTPGDWVVCIEPGHTLEAHALAYFGDTINHAPQSRLIYCDEDVRNASGKQYAPRFKPDINVELIKNMYYLGNMLAIERQSLLLCGGWSSFDDACFYDLALRVIDHVSPEAIIHQRDLLLHAPEKCLRSISSDTEQKALREHVDRNKLMARIESGFLEGTQKITYPPQGSPLISIIIPTRDQPGYLSHCIESISTLTLYPNWELILVDHATQDPDALDYIESLLDTPPFVQPVRVIRTEGEFNYARLCNLGVSEARGEFLLFLDNDTEIIQPDWLGILVGYLQQPMVSAVNPRLSQPDAKFAKILNSPRMLGVGGLANGILTEPTSLVAPGYCGRLQVAQDCSALSGSCFAINAAELKEIGSFNEIDTPAIESVLDVCLRLRQQGQRLIWTPWVDVVHHDAISRKRFENDPLIRSKVTEQILTERDYFNSKYLNWLKDDPNYHRHLSLNTACAVEPNAVIDWDTRFHDRLRILGLPLTSGSGEYRMTSPFRALQMQGLAQANIVHPIAHKIQRVLTPVELARYAPDTLMLQQAIDDVQINQLKRYRKFSPEVFITYAVDDVLGNLPRKHYLYNFQAREGKSRMREGLSHCDRLIVSTTPIADYCKDMIGEIVVVPNRLERSVWCEHTSLRSTSKKPRVGWAGAQQHLGDLELIREVVESLADEVDWIFMGMCPDFLKPYIKEEHDFVGYAEYPAKLASLNLDLAIAPLEKHLFNEGKSNLRLLEYGIMGWPVVCTDIFPYQTNNAPVKRVENTVKEWTAAIRERISDLDATYKEGDALRKWVLKHYILEEHISEWLDAVTPISATQLSLAP